MSLPIGIDNEITFKANYQFDPLLDFCIYDVQCYTNRDDMLIKRSTADGNFDPLSDNVEMFGIVEYHCGNASGFDFGTHVQDTLYFECSGYNVWNRSLTLEPCVCKFFYHYLINGFDLKFLK